MSDLVTLGFRADTRGLLGAQRELDKTTAAGGRLDKQSTALTKTLGLVGAAITAVGVTAGTRQIIQYADSWANLNTQLRQVTKSEQELVDVRSQLLAVSRDTRIDLDATVGLYTEMTRGTSELGISSEKLLGITKTLNNLFLAGGKPLSEMTGAIRQLNQGFASGVLRGDEFNSVADGAPRILDAMAAKLNMTRGELRAFAATGGITAGVMVEALADFEGTAQKLADTVKITFEQTMGLVQTNITEFVGQNELLTGSVESLGSSLLSLSENLDAVGYALGAAATVVGVSLLPVMGKYLISVGAAAYANITAVPAVTGMSAALGVQAKALTTGAVAANAFGVAWRVALGPVGLLVTALGAAAVAFNLVSESMDEANEKAEKHSKAMSELETIYSKWSKTRLEDERNKLLKRSNEILFERLDIEERIQKLSANATMQRGMENIVNPEVLAEIEELEKSLASLADENENIDNSLSKVLDVLDTFITKKKEATTTVDKSIDSNRKLADSYNSQILSLHNQ
ncbi:MAG: tape measure protein, partial [Psychrobacter sp.]